MEKFELRKALEQRGAKLNDEQITFIDGLEAVLELRSAKENESASTAIKNALDTHLGATEKDKDGNVVPIAAQIRSIAESMEKVEQQTTKTLSNKEKFQLRSMIEKNKPEIVNAIKTGQDFEITFSEQRAAAMFTTTSAMTNGTGVLLPLVENYLVENDIAKIRYPKNFILEVIPNSQVAKVPSEVIRTEQATAEGAVTVVAEGGTKPLTSDTFIKNRTPRKKYAGRIEWTEEFEMDNEMLFAEIVRLFEDKVVRAWQDGLIATIQTNAVAYTTSVFDDTFVVPDNGLAIIAGQSVIEGMYFTPDTVIMNPSDIFAAMFTQDIDGRPQFKPYMTVSGDGSYRINGMRVFSSYKIAQGTALVGEAGVYKEWHSDFILRFGTYNDQFIKNQKTAIGEVFSLLRIANNEKPAWMVLTLATVKAALLKPAV